MPDPQLFFVGGAPRSGTTWLQQILDAHPDVSCMGEGLFERHLAGPIDQLVADWSEGLKAKNTRLFQHTGGYPIPEASAADDLLRAAILQALARQTGGVARRAVGEKTPENVFFFPRLLRLFAEARFIAIARDPRDVLTSAWHFFHKSNAGEDQEAAKLAFVRAALPSINHGARTMLGFAAEHPGQTLLITYEALLADTPGCVARLYAFLGVPVGPWVVEDALSRTSFAAMTQGRPRGAGQDGSFFRKGVAGDWRSTFSEEVGALIVAETGWMFPRFGFVA